MSWFAARVGRLSELGGRVGRFGRTAFCVAGRFVRRGYGLRVLRGLHGALIALDVSRGGRRSVAHVLSA